MRSVSLGPGDVKELGQKRLAGIRELLDLKKGVTATGFRQSELECFHKEVLGMEVSEAAVNFRSEDIPLGPISVVILVNRKNLNTSCLEEDFATSIFIWEP